ncbi:cytochrome P450 [Mycena capillaripes]|nr:cytochrome P450 [Mycena capillaripes]
MLRRRLNSPFRHMPGPPNPNPLLGYAGKMHLELSKEWQNKYGPTFKLPGILGASSSDLYTIDPVALQRVVNHLEIYQKPQAFRIDLSLMLGRGLLVVEDDEHTKLRKIMSPAFGPSQIRQFTEIFVDKSVELRDVWSSNQVDENGQMRIDVFAGLKKMTLDVIGLAGFNYAFDALNAAGKPNELDQAFTELFNKRRFNVFALFQARFFLLRYLPTPMGSPVRNARKTMDRVSIGLLNEAREALESGVKEDDRRDLLSLLLRSNMSKDIPESHRLSDAVMAAPPTFFVAGHETTSTATAWALYALACDLKVQTRLRAELQTIGTGIPSLDTLNSLPYLENVLREIMRLHSPVVFTMRVAMADDVLPLGTPYADTRGVQHDSIPCVLSFELLFQHLIISAPDRWDAVPAAASAIPGVWSHLFSFLGGGHNCIGYRFSIAEMKALLFVLLRAFEFELAVPAADVTPTHTPVQRPTLRSEPGKNQLPMLVRPILV